MSEMNIYCLPGNAATDFAGQFLKEAGICVSHGIHPGVTHVLLPVPTRVQAELPPEITVIGGNLSCPGVDLLKDPWYLAENAAITARCAMDLMGQDLKDLPVLVLGWGRIGKCLGKSLQKKGAYVTIAARKDPDLAMIDALGYRAMDLNHLKLDSQFIINTIPAMVLPQGPANVYAIELASKPGMGGENVIIAKGLPGKMRPAESGRLIAETFMRLSEVEL